jgi:hypothetical protein
VKWPALELEITNLRSSDDAVRLTALQLLGLTGSVDILGHTWLKNEKQIPHPAKNAGIRDDKFPGAGIKNRMSTEPVYLNSRRNCRRLPASVPWTDRLILGGMVECDPGPDSIFDNHGFNTIQTKLVDVPGMS